MQCFIGCQRPLRDTQSCYFICKRRGCDNYKLHTKAAIEQLKIACYIPAVSYCSHIINTFQDAHLLSFTPCASLTFLSLLMSSKSVYLSVSARSVITTLLEPDV